MVLVYLPPFAAQLSGAEFAERMKLELVPLMIYGDHVTYIVTEEGIANLLLFRIAKEWQLLAARSVKDLVSWSRGPVSAAG